MEYYSQVGQDKIILDYLKNKRDGYFIDIGCAAPFGLSNTATMETELGWKGLGFDLRIEDPGHNQLEIKGGGRFWNERPNTKTFEGDVLKLDLEKIFEEENVPEVVDFLSVDLEPWQPTFEVFKNIPHNKYKFRTIAFEHDGYRSGYEWVVLTNKYITDLGYKFLKDVNNQDAIYVLED